MRAEYISGWHRLRLWLRLGLRLGLGLRLWLWFRLWLELLPSLDASVIIFAIALLLLVVATRSGGVLLLLCLGRLRLLHFFLSSVAGRFVGRVIILVLQLLFCLGILIIAHVLLRLALLV